MRYVQRELETQVRKAARSFPACKAGRTVTPAMAAPMQRLAEAARKKRAKGTRVDMSLVHQAPTADSRLRAVASGVQALPWREFVEGL
jgi:hypothetical protein